MPRGQRYTARYDGVAHNLVKNLDKDDDRTLRATMLTSAQSRIAQKSWAGQMNLDWPKKILLKKQV